MKAAGWQVLKQLLILLFLTAPITLFVIQFDPVVPYTPVEFSMGVSGFPFAFCEWGGGSSNANRIMLAPYLIDVAIVGTAVQLIANAIRVSTFAIILWPLAVFVTLIGGPLIFIGEMMMWGGNWGIGWWSIP